jgi:hypothetical protein
MILNVNKKNYMYKFLKISPILHSNAYVAWQALDSNPLIIAVASKHVSAL